MRLAATVMGLLAVFGFYWAAPTAASAKSKGKSCARAEAVLLETGQGDRDGDGLSDCRERRQLGTLMNDADSDDDSVSDGDEVAQHSDPRDADSDDDGIEDGEDETPGIPEQEVEGFLDALSCPQLGVPGSITALGVTATLYDTTAFEHATCEALAALLGTGAPVFVEIEILEDSTGALTAAEVEVEDDGEHGDDEGGSEGVDD